MCKRSVSEWTYRHTCVKYPLPHHRPTNTPITPWCIGDMYRCNHRYHASVYLSMESNPLSFVVTNGDTQQEHTRCVGLAVCHTTRAC